MNEEVIENRARRERNARYFALMALPRDRRLVNLIFHIQERAYTIHAMPHPVTDMGEVIDWLFEHVDVEYRPLFNEFNDELGPVFVFIFAHYGEPQTEVTSANPQDGDNDAE